ncbi:hypothetical protein [Nonomuraea maritima]|uniref:hypothetical protein n=1 Tax=Nonomuraea maritima TaxID=683260 RepID=UPI0015A41E80|nr:hypothetical protein [Nonomuraea maritima]
MRKVVYLEQWNSLGGETANRAATLSEPEMTLAERQMVDMSDKLRVLRDPTGRVIAVAM